MKFQLELSIIAILLLFRTAITLSMDNNLKSKLSALRNLARVVEKNGETICADDIEEINYFLKIGDENIERTIVKDVIIVIGASGVGKSTLTQFVGNETNTLRASCTQWDECTIIDDSDTIGGDLLSRTFLPNLVFHESTQTAFYDMPGFNDNRNESMEIANSFFMQQILEDAEAVKILVLAKFESFANSARLDFPKLLRNLVDLIKSPVKFRGGMAIISTMAPPYTPHANIIGQNTGFLKDSLLPNISALFDGEEKYIRGATETVENWLEADTEHFFDAKYYSYFLVPNATGHLLEHALMRGNKEFLEEVIWNRLQFIPKESGDFGLPMSAEAKLKVMDVGSCISNTLARKMDTFAEELKDFIQTYASNLMEGSETDIVDVSELLTNLIESNFSFDDLEGQPLSAHLEKLLTEVDDLNIPSLDETRQLIAATLTFIQFIELVNVDIQFDPRLWTIKMRPLGEYLLRFLDQTGLNSVTLLATLTKKFAEDFERYLRISLSNIIDGKEGEIVHISELLKNLTKSDFSFDNMEGQPLSTHLQKLLTQVNNLLIPISQEIQQQLTHTLTFIQFIELVNVKIQFDSRLWIIEMKSMKGNLIKFLDPRVNEVLDVTIHWFAEVAKAIAASILTAIHSLNNISDKVTLLSSEVTRVESFFENINSVKPMKNLTDFLIFYSSEYDIFRGIPSDTTIPHFNALSVLEILDEFSWSNKDWTYPSILTLQYPLVMDRDLTIFLRALFTDLSQPTIQTGENSAIYTWWSQQIQLTQGNFNCFYSKIIIEGFTSPILFDKSYVRKFVFYTTKGRKRLEFLLNFLLNNVYNCSTSTEVIVIGPIISFDRIISRCTNPQLTTNIVLLATHKIYANSKLIGREINSNNNINVIIMSPEMIVIKQSEIDLSGKDGEQSVHGKPAGTQYVLFQNISTNDGSILTRITYPNVTGGSGVDGLNGSTGQNNLNSGTNNFNANTDDCAAWLGGDIQIRNYENTCNDYTCSKCYCKDRGPGIQIDIFGMSGPKGENGGDGKHGSCGGAGGQSYWVHAMSFELPKTVTNGLQGKNGKGGSGGAGGLGGLYGNTLKVWMHVTGEFHRFCYESSRTIELSSRRGPSGSRGVNGTDCTSTATENSVNRAAVTNHFASFKAALTALTTNEFLFSQATLLLNLLGNARPFD